MLVFVKLYPYCLIIYIKKQLHFCDKQEISQMIMVSDTTLVTGLRLHVNKDTDSCLDFVFLFL